MTAYRSSLVRYAEDYCPRAVDFAEQQTPRDRDVFDVGIAAHAVLDALCRRQRELGRVIEGDEAARVGQAVAMHLVKHGRSFDGIPEPPMAPQDASAGRELAVRAWYVYPTELEDRSEHGLAVDKDWQPVAYDSPRAWWKAAVDLVGPCVGDSDDDEFDPPSGIVVTDYKSAWPTSAAELDSIQIRGQALAALAHAEAVGFPEPAFVRRRVINLRTLQAFERDLDLGDEDAERTLTSWRNDVRLAVASTEARDSTGARVARPGARCLGCPYLQRCEAARAFLRGSLADDPVKLATRLVVADAVRKELLGWAKHAAAEAPIEVEGGCVGHIRVGQREPVKNVVGELAAAWFQPADPAEWSAQNGQLLGLLRALDIGVGAVESVATALHPKNRSKANTASREALVARLTTTTHAAKFGVHRHKEPTE